MHCLKGIVQPQKRGGGKMGYQSNLDFLNSRQCILGYFKGNS